MEILVDAIVPAKRSAIRFRDDHPTVLRVLTYLTLSLLIVCTILSFFLGKYIKKKNQIDIENEPQSESASLLGNSPPSEMVTLDDSKSTPWNVTPGQTSDIQSTIQKVEYALTTPEKSSEDPPPEYGQL